MDIKHIEARFNGMQDVDSRRTDGVFNVVLNQRSGDSHTIDLVVVIVADPDSHVVTLFGSN